MATKKMNVGARLTTPKGRLSFHHLFAPDVGGQYSDGKYKATILFDKADAEVVSALKAIKKECQRLGVEAFGGDAKFELPFRDGADKADALPSYEGKLYITPKTKQRPGVVGPNVKPLEEGDLYSGCWVRATITPFAYSQGKNQGISFWLGNIQKIKDDTAFGGSRRSAADEFDAVGVEESPAAVQPEDDDDLPF